MSKWGFDDRRFARALLVSQHHPDNISLLDALAHYSRADPFEITGEEHGA